MTPVIALAALAIGGQSASISDFYQKEFEDASFRARVVSGNQRELAKINDDFGQSYRFKYIDVKLKEPFMLRTESTVDDTSVLMILNGSRQLLRVPKARIAQRTNLENEPGRRQTALDFGLLTPALFRDIFDATFVRLDRATGDYVFDLTYKKRFDYDAKHRIWVDKDKKYVSRREWYDRRGSHKATFFYTDPIQSGGIWVPTRLTVRNADNKVAGETRYENMQVNKGISPDLFKV